MISLDEQRLETGSGYERGGGRAGRSPADHHAVVRWADRFRHFQVNDRVAEVEPIGEPQRAALGAPLLFDPNQPNVTFRSSDLYNLQQFYGRLLIEQDAGRAAENGLAGGNLEAIHQFSGGENLPQRDQLDFPQHIVAY